jgi:hypothetical protein
VKPKHKHWFQKFVEANERQAEQETKAKAWRMVWEGLRFVHRGKWTRDDKLRRFM